MFRGPQDGKPNQLSPVTDVQFLPNAGSMSLHRLDAHLEFFGNVLALIGLSNQRQHFQFTIGESVYR